MAHGRDSISRAVDNLASTSQPAISAAWSCLIESPRTAHVGRVEVESFRGTNLEFRKSIGTLLAHCMIHIRAEVPQGNPSDVRQCLVASDAWTQNALTAAFVLGS